MRLTVKERILLHLLDSAQSLDAVEVSSAVTQSGVAQGAGIEVRHLSQFVRPLIRDGLVKERTGHVTGRRQRMKVYGLTQPGRAAAIRLRDQGAGRIVQIRGENQVHRQGSRGEPHEVGRRTGLLEAVQQVQRSGVLELERPQQLAEPGFVEQVSDAPQLGTFVGRREELAELTREDAGPRVFVIRGIAGIGKSSLAARACALVRGRKNLFWHRIRPWDSDLTILATLGRFFEALDRPGLSAVLKRGDSNLAAEVLRQDLPDTHAYLVLDDAHEASPPALKVIRMLVEAVASAPDSRMLVLTRRALPLFGVRSATLEGSVREIELGGLTPDEAAALLSEGGDSTPFVGMGRCVSGHPLLIELARHQPLNLPGAVRDMHRFLEEEVYRDLSEGERTIMKALSLYRVPVPRATLLSVPGSTYESAVALEDRSLLRFVGGERYEIHDAIRDFCEGILTKEERQRFGALAAVELRELASQATASGDTLASIACLSNALRVAESSDHILAIAEALGDANRRIGDALAMSTAYRDAMSRTKDSETLARLHRKMAFAFEEWGQYNPTAREIDAGFAALGDTDSVERGWLELVRAQMIVENGSADEGWGPADSACQLFRRFHEPAGEAEALHVLGSSAALAGRVLEDGTPAFMGYFTSALDLAVSESDPIPAARIHLSAAAVLGHGIGVIEEAREHFQAVEASPQAMADPVIRATLHLTRAWISLVVGSDYVGAKADLAQAERIAERVHDAKVHANAVYLLAVPARAEGRYGDAARCLSEAGSETAAAGLTAFAFTSFAQASEHYLAAGDWEGYRKTEARLQALWHRLGDPKGGLLWLQHQGLDELIHAKVEGFEDRFREFFLQAKKAPRWSYARTGVWWGHYFYAMGLRALGRRREASAHLQQAEELLRLFSNRMGQDLIRSDFGDRLTRSLRDAIGASAGTAA